MAILFIFWFLPCSFECAFIEENTKYQLVLCSAVYFRFMTLKDSKTALFGEENLMFKFAGYKNLTLPRPASSQPYPALSTEGQKKEFFTLPCFRSGQGRVTLPCDHLCPIIRSIRKFL
jgi:hypothetical protein